MNIYSRICVLSEVIKSENNDYLDFNCDLKICKLNVEKVWHSSEQSVGNNNKKRFKGFWPKCRFRTNNTNH